MKMILIINNLPAWGGITWESLMKNLFGLMFLVSLSAFAHGPLSEQAANAILEATTQFENAHPKEITKQLLSVSAVLTGHEKFDVVVALKDERKFPFVCVENEEVLPVVWECKAQ